MNTILDLKDTRYIRPAKKELADFLEQRLYFADDGFVFCNELFERWKRAKKWDAPHTAITFGQFMYFSFPDIKREKRPKGKNGKEFNAYIGLKFIGV